MKFIRNNLHLGAGLLTLAAQELIISKASAWLQFFVILVIIVLVSVRLHSVDLRIKGWYRAVVALLIPGFAALLFIELPVWQHVYAVGFATLICMLFYRVKAVAKGDKTAGSLQIFALVNIFLATAMAMGLQVFFRTPPLLVVSVLIALVTIFPPELVITRRKEPGDHLPLPGLAESGRRVDFWLYPYTMTGAGVNHPARDELRFKKSKSAAKFLLPNMNMGRHKFLVLLIAVEFFMVASVLPLNIIISSCLVMLSVSTAFVFYNSSRLGALNKMFFYRTIGLLAALVMLLLGTAQWT